MSCHFTRRFGVCLLLLLGAAARAAVPPSPVDSPPLDFASAVARTLRDNPALARTSLILRRQDARIEQAAQRPAPELSLQVEDVLGTGQASGVRSAQSTLVLSQVIELGGLRQRRIEAAEAERLLREAETRAAELDVLAELTRRFIAVVAAQERLALRERGLHLAERTVAAVLKRVEAARAPDVELYRARIAEQHARLGVESGEHELASARRLLAAMWGGRGDAFGRVEADLYAMPPLVDFAVIESRLAHSPATRRLTTEARLRDAELRLAVARRTPPLSLSAGVRRLDVIDDHAFVASVAFPLFTASRAAPAIAEAQAQRALVDADLRVEAASAPARLFELYQEMLHARHQAALLRDQIRPAQEAVLEAAERAYLRGRYSYLDWHTAQAERLQSEAALIEAALSSHRLLADIERLTGESMTRPTAGEHTP